ncbi:plasmid mobilization relaxosome protein MobC [Moritella viscosa]|uniref:Catalase-peroxidase 2-Peroxidase/catalase 2 n=1 Tax=Moritella viscosa TaxID=80854 RepID=A0A1L0AVV4_9GAMM|nr:plasmid mobilization relaxosome protein MobC [Moritella viscosa]SGY92762.1 Catalase-peroxidase 2-Peroxidase/catalase 2 [Moritella viscosa]SGZ08943.1 Catalase-peroxidase 2-Peroxidase/catalase 2 [Moritella viscosa]SGZ09211.1 Catalase-peroxidase 2-Peroxidase/catalase 2 [Moritella viscosa]
MKNNKERKPERKRINIRLDDPVFDELQDLKKLGKFKSWEALILFLMSEKRGLKKVYIDQDGHSVKVLNHLNKYANNLNQLAKVANECKQIDNSELEKIRDFFNQGIKARNYFNKKVIPFYNERKK